MPYKHFTLDERIRLEDYLNRGLSCKEMGLRLGKDPTSVSREVERNRTSDGRRRGYEKRSTLCRAFRECAREGVCGGCLGGRCATCNRADCTASCPDFDEVTCPKVTRFPHVCNGCGKRSSCRLERFSYHARIAQARADVEASDPRRGVDLTGAQLAGIDALVTPLMANGQSLNQVYLAHADEIPCSLRSLYTHVNRGEVGPGRMMMIDAVRRKPRRKPKAASAPRAPRKSLEGRTWADFSELDEEQRAGRWEMDTVVGARGGGRCLLTLLHRPSRLQLALPLDSCSSGCVVSALGRVARAAGERSGQLLYLVLTDNGGEFFDAEGIEAALGCRLFYCESYSSWQKGAAECNHKYYRRIVGKGEPMEALDDAACALMMSHVNSAPRACLGGASPIEAALPVVGAEFLDALGVRAVPRDEVTLLPSLLDGAGRG